MLSLLYTLLSFAMVISILVFIHEGGHYLAARLCRVRVMVFSIGFGKELFGFNDKHGTRWKFSALPLGGYVKMYGDASEASTQDKDALAQMNEEERAQAFHFKPLWQKAIIVVAGPLANILLTMIIFFVMLWLYGMPATQPLVGELLPDSPAAKAGLQTDDRIMRLDDEEMEHFRDITQHLALNQGEVVRVEFYREGEGVITRDISPMAMTMDDGLGNSITRYVFGIKSKELELKELGIVDAVGISAMQTVDLMVMSYKYLGQLITGKRDASEMRGPVGIAQMSGQAVEQGIRTLLWFMALISINLGIVNLLPIPPLDGGHLLFYVLEGIKGRPLAEKVQNAAFAVGFALVAAMMLFTVFNDIRALFS